MFLERYLSAGLNKNKLVAEYITKRMQEEENL